MSINFDIVIETTEYAVDMKAGLDTLQGISDATRTIAESVLTQKIVKRQSHKSKVRTNLKQTFKGSYGHIYSLDIYDEKLRKEFNKIGKSTFAEIMTYFFHESLYIETRNLSRKAEKIIEKLGVKSEELIMHLRSSVMENVHEVSTKFNHEVMVSFRKSSANRDTIAKFNMQTAESLQATTTNEQYDITACITRFNIFTGNGRLLIKNTSETVAFGFRTRYEKVTLEAKKIFSDNLNNNNGLDPEYWKYLKIEVNPLKLRDGKIIKYIVTGFYSE